MELRSLAHEDLEGRQMLAFSAMLNGTELVFFNAANDSSTVSLFMQNATGTDLYYSIDGGPLTPAPTPFGTGPQTGITGIRILDSVTDGSGSGGDTLELYGYDGATIDISGKNLLFGGTTPIITLNVENFLVDGLESRSAVNLDGVSVTNDLTVRNASVTTVAGTTRFEVGRNLSIDTSTMQLSGALSVGGTASLVLSGGVLQAANAPITAGTLTVINSVSGDVLLTSSDNAVDFLSIRNLTDSGAVAFTDADGLTVGAGGFGIVANNDAVTISSGGRLQLNANIEAGDGTVYLVAANGIGQAADKGVIARSLTFRNGTAPVNPSLDVTLLGSLNGVDILAGVNYSFDGDISFSNSKGLSIGAGVDGISGLTNFAGVISVTAGGQLSLDDAVLANNDGKVVLAALNGVQQTGAGRIVGRDVTVSNTASGAVSLGVAANDAAYLSIINKTPDGTIAYADANSFTVGIGGIATTTDSGSVTLTANGTIDQVGSIVTRTLTVSNLDVATGSLSLGLATNDVSYLNLSNANAKGSVTYADASGFEVGPAGIDAAGNAVSLTAAGAVTQSGDVLVDSLAIKQTATGGVDFTRTTNSIPTLTGSITAGTLAVTTQTPLVIGSAGIAASAADVRVTADGSITQVGTVAAQSLYAENTSVAAGDILFVNPLNAIASFTAVNPNPDGTVDMVTAGSTAIGAAGVKAAGDINITVAGSLNDTGTINLIGTLDSTAGDVTITAAKGSLVFAPTTKQISVSAGNLTLQSLVGQVLSAPTLIASGDVTISGYGTVTLTEHVTSLDGNVAISSLTGDLALGAGTAVITAETGSVTLKADCGMIVVQRVCAAGDVIVQSGLDITLYNLISSDSGDITVAATGGRIQVLGSGKLQATAGSVNVSASRDVTGLGGGVTAVNIESGGLYYQWAIVTIAPPASGSGRAAKAVAVFSPPFDVDDATGEPVGGVIRAINVIDPGYGYAPGEEVAVTIVGNLGGSYSYIPDNGQTQPGAPATPITVTVPAAQGARAYAIAAITGSITAGKDVVISSGLDLSLDLPIDGNTVKLSSDCGSIRIDRVCAQGEVNIDAPQGVSVGTEVQSATGDVTISATAGAVALVDLYAGQKVTVDAAQDINVTGLMQAIADDIKLTSTSGGISVTSAGKVHALQGDVDLEANRGLAIVQDAVAGGDIKVDAQAATATNLSAGNAITVTSQGLATVSGDVVAKAGAIGVTSTAGAINLSANMSAAVDAISLTAKLGVQQSVNSGVMRVQVVSGGSVGSAVVPTVTVTIAAPAAGGTAATATAVLQQTGSIYTISSIVLTNPGSGYALNESPAVTITGMPGASATAFTRSSDPAVLARKNLSVTAGDDIQLVSTFRSNTADITIQSTSGNLVLGADTFFAHALAGSVILDSDCGTVVVERVCAETDVTITGEKGVTVEGDIDAGNDILVTAGAGSATVTDLVAGGDIEITGHTATVTDLTAGNAITVTSQGLATVSGDVVAKAGAVGVTSTVGAINLTANVAAAQEVTLDAAASIIQPSTSGIAQLTLSAGGSGYTAGAVVTIAAPAAGGTAARATAVVTDGVVTALVLTSPGSGYAVGESPLVTITGNLTGGGQGAPAREAGSGAAAVASGPTAIPGIKGKAVTVLGDAGVSLNSFVIATDGDIVVKSSQGSVSVDSGSVLLQAEKGKVALNSDAGYVAVRNVLSDDDIDITGFGQVSLVGEIRSTSGGIAAASLSGSVALAANLKAELGEMSFKAHGSITQATESGLSGIELITGGSGYTLGATVTIAAPVGGGVAAKAVATLENGVVTKLTLTDSGSGYAVGETPSVTISGGATAGAVQGSGAAARASGPVTQQQLRAGTGIAFEAGAGVSLQSTIATALGDISVATKTGNLALDSGALTLQALAGNLRLKADTGVVSAQRLLAADDITIKAYSNASVVGEAKADGAIVVTSDAGKAAVTNLTAGDAITVTGKAAVTLAGEIQTSGSSLTATSSAGTVEFSANINANKTIELSAAASVNQLNSTGISSITLRAGGSGYTLGAKVTVAPPAAGGTAATAEAVVEFGVVTGIVITQSGSGYAVGENPTVTVMGNLSAGGPNAPPAPVGGGASAVASGPLSAPRVVAGEQITISGNTGVSLNSLVESVTKGIVVESAAGVLSLDAASLKMKAKEGITLETDLSAIAAGNLYAGGLVKVNAAGNLSLVGEIQSAGAGLDLVSNKGAVTLGANLLADSGSISVSSAGSLVQAATGGLSGLQLTAGGSGYTSRVVVTIAPPQGGGVAAQAAAIVTDGAITGLVLTVAGSGYAVGESPLVTFAAGPADALNPGGGGAGAAARAIGPISLPRIYAKDDISIESGASTTLTTLVRSTDGDVSVRAKTGDLALSAGSFAVITDSAASAIALKADTGSVNLRRADAAGSISVDAGQFVTVTNVSADGDAAIQSTAGVIVEQLLESGGKASISATNGAVTVSDVVAGDGIGIASGDSFLLQRVLRAEAGGVSIESGRSVSLGTATTDSSVIALGGNITARSRASGIALDARLVAPAGQIILDAQGAVTQSFGTGVTRFQIVNGGLSSILPTVTLTIAAPAAGGEAATATAVIGSQQVGTTFLGVPINRYFIESILVTNVGRGYAVGENPIVTVSGIDGAVIQAFGPAALRTLDAGTGVSITGRDDVRLVNTVTSTGGDIAVESISGNVNLSADTFFAHALSGSVTLTSDCGTVAVERACAELDVTIIGEKGVTVERDVDAGRNIKVTASAGPATVTDLTAGKAITVTSQGLATVSGDVVAKDGAIDVTSTAGGINLTANVRASTGSVTMTSNLGLLQTVSSGVTDIVLLNGGQIIQDAAPTVTVTIAPPADPRGVAATATAQVAQVGTTFFGTPIWSITKIEITNPGSGYAAGESPQVTIAGMPNAAAQAIVRNVGTVGTIVAEQDLTVVAGGDVQAVSAFLANAGDVSIRSIGGSLVLGADTFLAQAVAGSVTLQSDAGTVTVERASSGLDAVITGTKGVTVERSTDAGRDIVVTANGGQATVTDLNAGRAVTVTSKGLASLNGDVVATSGAIAVTSTSDAINLRANMNAAGDTIALTANLGVVQSVNSGVSRVTVVSGGQAVGATPPAVTVTIAGPAAGGTAATATAVITQAAQTGTTPLWTISQIIITNPGSGYAVSESPLVTITGMPGASALAFARSSDPAVVADDALTVTAGGDVVLVSVFRSSTADVDIRSISGNLDLSANTFFAHALAGGVTLTSDCGTVVVEKVCAANDVAITGEQGVDVENEAESEDGNVTINAASGEANILNVSAGKNVTVSSGDTFTLLGVIASDSGDVSITSRNRDLDFTASGAQVHALQGGVALAALNGTIMSPPTLHASKDVTLTSFNTLVLNNEITSDTGVIDLKSTSGSINLGANLDARDDSIRINAKGSVTQIGGGIGFVRVLSGGSGYTTAATVTIAAPSGGGVAARAVPIIGRVNGVSGVITGIRLTSPGSGYGAGEQPAVTFTRNATPPAGVTWLDASAIAVASPALGNSGLAAIDVLVGGSGYNAATTVTIAAPAGGGTAATAQAVIGTVVGDDGTTTEGVIIDIVIVNPGSGYGAGEQPVVTITGAGTGASARAIANITLQDIRAGNNIDIAAGTGVTLLNTIRADQGHVSIVSDAGNVNLAARTLLVSSFADDIEITARRGAIAVQRLAADGDITLKAQTGVTLLNAVNSTGEFGTGDVSIYTINGNIAAVAPNGLISVQNGGVSLESVNGTIIVPQVFNVKGDISLKTYGSQAINQALTSTAGSITVASATGSVALSANVFADDRVTLSAKTGIAQTKGFMQGNELVARNASTSAVNLGMAKNDFANVSIMSLGAVTYVDANDFETGVDRNPYSGTPLGVEMTGDSLSLSSVATNSRIRVVSGLKYRTLSIAAGTQGGTSVGYVDYVTTSGGDNPQANAAFQGTLRDMIRYSNDNTATYISSGSTRLPQPQAMVFDEYGYTVEEVKLGAALPAFSRPVWFDGGRLEETATVDRIGIAGNASIAYGLAFGPATAAVTGVSAATPGSAGSTIQHVAAYGFTKGAAIVLASGNNTVLDLHAGLKADGTVPGNFVGLDISGTVAVNNQIGAAVFDPNAVNRFGGNTSAGILIRNGAAGTRVYGSVIGDDTGFTPALANGDGIRVTNATRNWIGTPDEVQADLAPSRSNLIMGNRLAGVQISGSVAGTISAANLVRNNYIAGNGTGINIAGSTFAVLGGTDGRSANVIVGQTGAGVAVADSTKVQIQGNRVGIVPAFGFDAEAVRGNAGDGIAITGKTSAVEISSGNWIGGNQGSGVTIGTGVTGVTLTGNTIGGTLADGTVAGNGRDGVAITAAIGNVVGADNTISNNVRHGVNVTDARSATLLAGNRVFGSAISGNGGSGVFISGGSMTTIGGTTAGTANVITGNVGHGIRVETSTKTGAATGHAIQGNRIGTNVNGDVDASLGNTLSGISLNGAVGAVVGNGNVVMNNAGNGIEIVDGSGSTIGAATAAAGNVITNNAGSGVFVSGKATGINVMGNTITAQGADGVQIAANVRGVTIGQSVTQKAVTGAGNVIQGNAGWGVRVGANAQQIAVQGNSVSDNALGAITLATAANSVAPSTVTISSAIMKTASGGTRQIVLTGSLVGTGIKAKQQYSVDVYANPAASTDPQAGRFLGRFTVTATVNGRVNFANIVITATVAVDDWITASATSMVFDPGSTSSLSTPVRVRLR